MGASIGEPEYESYMLDGKVQKAISQVDDTVRRLSVSCASSLHSLLYYCCQSTVDYRFQHASSGAATVDPGQRFDTAIQSGITAASGQRLHDDPLLARRICLPVRRKGMGLRSRRYLGTAFRTASFIRACESFLDRGEGAGLVHGIFPSLTSLFGAGAFESGGHRFARFLSSGLDAAHAFRSDWLRMQLDAAVDGAAAPESGPLAVPASDAGIGGDGRGLSRLQHALTAQLEDCYAAALDSELRQLPPVDTCLGQDGGPAPHVVVGDVQHRPRLPS